MTKEININGTIITAHSDGSISKPDKRLKDNGIRRTFGTRNLDGYMYVFIGGKSLLVHRIIAQAFLSDFNDFPQVDHIGGNGDNNDVSNLRMVTNSGNQQAHQTKRKGCSSKYRGVHLHKESKKWIAKCKIDRKVKHLGYFNDEREAAIARDKYAFSRGFPLEGLNLPSALISHK